MKTQRRFAVIGGTIAIITVLAGMGIAEAFGPKLCCSPFFGPSAAGSIAAAATGIWSAFVLKRLDSKVEKLNLTPDQKAKYDELRAQVKERMMAAKEDRMKFREALRAEMAKESPDVAALNAMMKQKIEHVSGSCRTASISLHASIRPSTKARSRRYWPGSGKGWLPWTSAGRKDHERFHEERICAGGRGGGGGCREPSCAGRQEPVRGKANAGGVDFAESSCNSKDKQVKGFLLPMQAAAGPPAAWQRLSDGHCATPALK